jgi:hypothetical protein
MFGLCIAIIRLNIETQIRKTLIQCNKIVGTRSRLTSMSVLPQHFLGSSAKSTPQHPPSEYNYYYYYYYYFIILKVFNPYNFTYSSCNPNFCLYNIIFTQLYIDVRRDLVRTSLLHFIIKRQNSPVTGLEWPRGFQEVKVPRFHDNGTGWW